MSDDYLDHQLDAEELRAQMQSALRRAEKALVITIGEDGEPRIMHLNVTEIEHRGLVELLSDTAPKWRMDDE